MPRRCDIKIAQNLDDDKLRWFGEEEKKYLYVVVNEPSHNDDMIITYVADYDQALECFNEQNVKEDMKQFIKLYKIGSHTHRDMIKEHGINLVR